MCGLTGFLALSDTVPDRLPRLHAATAALRHRGPDRSAVFEEEDGSAGMGFARLSIIDLSEAGQQPMANEDGNLLLTCNGEIYNHGELRQRLQRKGHRFRSQSDSEVILHLYEELGNGLLDEIDGMYAFVIYDRKKKQVFAARDRFGKKPLYWARTPSGLYWASEFRSLLHLVPEPLDEDLQGFYHYTTFNCFPREFTYFKQINKLMPGHFLELSLSNSRPRIQQYYALRIRGTEDPPEMRRERVRALFEAAVLKRLMSDAPVGFFLSGGIDSTAIVTVASRVMPRVMTFSVGVEGDPKHLDELPPARSVAERCGAEIHARQISDTELRDLIVEAAWALDEPLCSPDTALLSFLSGWARDAGAKVMLSGDGSDEVFFGYPEYWNPQLQQYREEVEPLSWIPPLVRDSAHEILRRVPSNRLARVRARLAGRRFFTGNNLAQTDLGKVTNLAPRVLHDPGVREWSDVMVRRLLKTAARTQRLSPHKLIMLNDFNIRLPEYLLMRVDKVTMANSIETRCPFLDRELVEYAAGLPVEDLYDGRFGKLILRQSMQGLLGDDIAWRPKLGFGGGSPNFVKPAVARMMLEVLEGAGFLSDYYSTAYLDQLRRRPANKRQFKDWNVVIFGLWKQRLADHMAVKARVHDCERVAAPDREPRSHVRWDGAT